MMKRMKKIVSLVLAMVMVMAMTMSVSAANITIDDGDVTGAQYKAYLLLKAEPVENAVGKYVFTMNEKYADILKKQTSKTTDALVAEYISGLDAAAIRTFANDVYAAIDAAQFDADYTAENNVFADVEQGYYLIVESALGTNADGTTDTYSLVMLDTAGKENITVDTKEDVPSVDKKVEEKNDTTGESSWGESADYDIGDEICYEITGTVSSKYAEYKSYYYSFSDKMDNGLTLNAGSIKVTISGVDVTEQFTIATTDHSFTATANLKELTGVEITGETKVIVTYTATLNENAVSGTTGNKNMVDLEFENDPYHKGDGDPTTPDKPEEPGKTPEDTNIVFTFDAIVNKTDDKGVALEGAGFTLYKDVEGAWTQIGEEIKGVTTFVFEGLDEGNYKLSETTVPEGYNKAEDIFFTIDATYVENAEKGYADLTNLEVKDAEGNVIDSFTVSLTLGEVSTTVVNKTGATLPETGGMGTTIFYLAGGILVVLAAVLLITKKRMSAE